MSGLVPIVMIALLMGAIVVYRNLQMRAFGSVELGSVLAEVTERGREVLDGMYADEPPRDADGARQQDGEQRGLRALPEGSREVAWPGRSGIIQDVDVPRIIAAARSADAAVEIVVPTGEMVHHRATVAVIHGSVDPSLDAAVVKAVRTGAGRTFEQDPTMAFRVLVDIALRALSPAINDPTTAVQVLDCEEDLLRMLVGRDLDAGEITGPHGRTRVLLALPELGRLRGPRRRRDRRGGRGSSAHPPARRTPPARADSAGARESPRATPGAAGRAGIAMAAGRLGHSNDSVG